MVLTPAEKKKVQDLICPKCPERVKLHTYDDVIDAEGPCLYCSLCRFRIDLAPVFGTEQQLPPRGK